jgi:predicted glycoside hydrolase/deacetylase ChbG (UPF0249 family)
VDRGSGTAIPAGIGRTDKAVTRTRRVRHSEVANMNDSLSPFGKRETDSPQAIDRTPEPPSTPSEGTSQRECAEPVDIVTRLNQTRADMLGTDDEDHYWDCHEAVHEIESLREAIRRLAEQDATLSVRGGNVTVTMDATFTDEEREAIERVAIHCADTHCIDTAKTLWGLLERTTHPER